MNRIDLPYDHSDPKHKAFLKKQRPWWMLGMTRGEDAGCVGGRGYMWRIGNDLYVIAHEGEHDAVVAGEPPIPGRFPVTLQPGESLRMSIGIRFTEDEVNG